ncbi:MAG TPA: serine hydrolase domain-containing protein [Gemmatimonadaceae bacterium]|jgi:CubicO group peptidase (beta-lactamase class C family)|nr:serine hydrolase domain-containing protein [Gemmatimonadaceae bacterium]
MPHISILRAIVASVAIASQLQSQSPDIAATADRYLSTRAEMGNFSGAVLIAKGGNILFRKGYGFADVEKRIPYTADTQHEVASISKMFTAMAALKLRNEGKLKLDDPICKYLDKCPDAWKPITISHLIHHTSGIPDYEEKLEIGSEKYMAFMTRPDASRLILDSARTQPLDFKPGEKFHYSNTAYNVLSEVIQRAAGMSFEDYVTRTLLVPARMTHSGVIGGKTKPVNLANGYTHNGLPWDKMLSGVALTDGHLVRVANLPLTQPVGDGWMYSTLDDLYRWSIIMDGGTNLVSKAEIAEVLAPGEFGYGFGWIVDKGLGHNRYRHTGALPGYISDFIKFPDDSVTIIVFSNMDRGRMSSVVRDLSAITLGTSFDMPVRGTVVTLTKEQMEPLVGEYTMKDGTPFSVRIEDMLVAQLKDRYTAGLIPLSATEFYMPLGDGRAIFTIDASGKASQVNMRYGGEDHIATRNP